jgi:hypothetical protein
MSSRLSVFRSFLPYLPGGIVAIMRDVSEEKQGLWKSQKTWKDQDCRKSAKAFLCKDCGEVMRSPYRGSTRWGYETENCIGGIRQCGA